MCFWISFLYNRLPSFHHEHPLLTAVVSSSSSSSFSSSSWGVGLLAFSFFSFLSSNSRTSSPMRPILKRSGSSSVSYTPPRTDHPPSHNPHVVHFPPQPSLTRTFSAHSSSTYDRTPIAVTPNSCALPERGCPGRTYTLDESEQHSPPSPTMARRGHPSNGRDLHPRALAFYSNPRSLPEKNDDDAQRTPTRGFPSLPALIPDLSSESDESDGFVSPPQDAYYMSNTVTYRRVSPGLSFGAPPYDQYPSYSINTTSTAPTPSSFLPHPPSPPTHSHGHPLSTLDDEEAQAQAQLQRNRRRRDRDRRRERSRSRDRVRSIQDDEDEYYEYDVDVLPSSPKPLRSARETRKSSLSPLCRTLSSLDIVDPDAGCLGGF